MEKIIYNEMMKELKRECFAKGRPIDDVLYSLSCMNNSAWREGRSTCLTKVEPIRQIKDKTISMKIHIK